MPVFVAIAQKAMTAEALALEINGMLKNSLRGGKLIGPNR